ncbi:MAG TPA: hypothetical protein VMM57_10895 [Bacteroidota bacterium]|nr:hypothetical protein [Bacteroidota bacterium]
MQECTACFGEVTDDSDYCPHCGIIFEQAAAAQCSRHPDSGAVAVCIICRDPLCKKCAHRKRGRYFCVDHRRVAVQQDWAEVLVSTEVLDAELAKSLLESNGFHVLAQNFQSVGFVWDGGGDSPVSRSNIGRPAKVLVPIPEYSSARRTIEEWRGAGSGREDQPVRHEQQKSDDRMKFKRR